MERAEDGRGSGVVRTDRTTTAPRPACLPLRWLLAIGVLAGVSCEAPRPEIAEWTSAWAERPQVPDLARFQAQEGRALCEALLTAARGAPERLLPTPDPELDHSVEDWILRVENLAYECPTGADQGDLLRDKLQEIHLLEAQVASALSVASGFENRASPRGAEDAASGRDDPPLR